ncbi:unnamed protein product [Pedinophyceae sp. YPF-701]|nr:unnamed protein product [Pedinophyceae sp. YPF-701]
MSERMAPWRSKPPAIVSQLIAQLSARTMFLVQRAGPTAFVVADADAPPDPHTRQPRKFRVSVGAAMTCSCSPPVSGAGPSPELCFHTLFVLTKVLRVPRSNPLVWQRSLMDRELDEVLRCSEALQRPAGAPNAVLVRSQSGVTDASVPPGQVAPREVAEGEVCAICYEDMSTASLASLVHCRFSCGRRVHGRCMRVWVDHQRSTGKEETSCPLCRQKWGEFDWTPPRFERQPREGRARDEAVHYGVACHGTSCGRDTHITGPRYRCCVCNSYDLCRECFRTGTHMQHPFMVIDKPGNAEQPAEERVAPSPGSPTGGRDAEAAARAAQRRAQQRVEQAQQRAGGTGKRPVASRTRSDLSKRYTAGTQQPTPDLAISGLQMGSGTPHVMPPYPAGAISPPGPSRRAVNTAAKAPRQGRRSTAPKEASPAPTSGLDLTLDSNTYLPRTTTALAAVDAAGAPPSPALDARRSAPSHVEAPPLDSNGGAASVERAYSRHLSLGPVGSAPWNLGGHVATTVQRGGASQETGEAEMMDALVGMSLGGTSSPVRDTSPPQHGRRAVGPHEVLRGPRQPRSSVPHARAPREDMGVLGTTTGALRKASRA